LCSVDALWREVRELRHEESSTRTSLNPIRN
jgi:hypothetical protein